MPCRVPLPTSTTSTGVTSQTMLFRSSSLELTPTGASLCLRKSFAWTYTSTTVHSAKTFTKIVTLQKWWILKQIQISLFLSKMPNSHLWPSSLHYSISTEANNWKSGRALTSWEKSEGCGLHTFLLAAGIQRQFPAFDWVIARQSSVSSRKKLMTNLNS